MDNRTSSGLTPGNEGGELALFGNVQWGVRAYDGTHVLTATVDGVLYYEAAGFCRITQHRNVPDAIATHVAEHQRMKLDISPARATIGTGYSGATWENVGPNPYRWFITREGANRLVLDSRVAGAQRIKHWLADDVMPAIEDAGSYIAPAAGEFRLDLDDLGALEKLNLAFGHAIAAAKQERAGRLIAEARVAELEPAAAQADLYASADGLTTKRAFARDVQQWATDRGVKVTQQQVFDFLAYIGLITRVAGSEHDQATAQAIKDGKAKNATKNVPMPDGSVFKAKYGKLTSKGEQYAWKRIYSAIGQHGTLKLDVIRRAVVPVA